MRASPNERVQPSEDVDFDSEVPLLIIGAGAAGLCAALAASEAGVEPVVIERDAVPSRIDRFVGRPHPGGGHALPARSGASRIRRSSSPKTSPARRMARPTRSWCRPSRTSAGPTVEWLADAYAMPFEVITDFNYPGHSAHRMHGLPSRTGAELIDRLRSAAEARDIPILTGRVCRDAVRRRGRLHRRRRGSCDGARDHRLRRAGARLQRLRRQSRAGAAAHPRDGRRALFRPSGQSGRRRAVGRGARRARSPRSRGYQGHGSVATPHNILITWAAITEGGFQVNREGRRFHNEALGYSEAAARGAAPAGRHCVRYFRRAHRRRRAAVRGFPQCREGRAR